MIAIDIKMVCCYFCHQDGSSSDIGLRIICHEENKQKKRNLDLVRSIKDKIARSDYVSLGDSTGDIRRIQVTIDIKNGKRPELNKVRQILEQTYRFDDITFSQNHIKYFFDGTISLNYWKRYSCPL